MVDAAHTPHCVFLYLSPRHRRFASRILFQRQHKTIQLLKLVSTPICKHSPANTPPPDSQSSSTPPAGGRILPSQPSGHPLPLLLAIILTPLPLLLAIILTPVTCLPSGHHSSILAVNLNPCGWSTSLLPTKRSSSTPPAGGHTHPTYPYPLLLVFHGERGKEGRG